MDYSIPSNQLIGCPQLSSALKEITDSAMFYQLPDARKPFFFITMEPGDGRSTVLKNIAAALKASKIQFFSYPDNTIEEYVLDGTLDQIESIDLDIRFLHTGYKNMFSGVIGISVEGLLPFLAHEQAKSFIRNILEYNTYSTIVLFADPSKAEHRQLYNRIVSQNSSGCDLDNHITVINILTRTQDDYANMILEFFRHNNIHMNGNDNDTLAAIREMIQAKDIRNASQAIQLALHIARQMEKNRVVSVFKAEDNKGG